MKKITLLLISSLFCFQLFALQVGHTTVTFVDPFRNNRQISTEVYYPAITAGNNTPIAAGTFPVIAFGHGFFMTWSAYQNFWDLIVPEGYILAFPTTESSILPSHSNFGEDLKFLISKIQSDGAGNSVPLSSIGNTSAIMGHSMGGGSSFLAAANNTSITTMISFAAANTNPSSVNASQQVFVPTLLFSGENDCVAPLLQHQNIMFDSLVSSHKTQITISGGGHCYFGNSNFNCTFGESTCSPSPTISRTQQQVATMDFLIPWLDYFLKNDCPKAQIFQDSLQTSSRISYRQSQAISCSTAIKNSKILSSAFTIFPNPFLNFVTINLADENIGTITLYNSLMQKSGVYSFSEGQKKVNLDLSSLTNGLYFIHVNNHVWGKFMKSNLE
jgi:dienelactone hydrolase